MPRFGNSEQMIIFGVLGGTLGLASMYTYYKCVNYLKKYFWERKWIKTVKRSGKFITPDRLPEIFEKLSDKEKRKGIEIPVYGFSMSNKTYVLYAKDPNYITKLLNKAIKSNGGLMHDLFVTQKYYKQYISLF